MEFVAQDLVQDDVLRRAEDVALDLGVGLFESGDELFRLETLGVGSAVVGAARAGFSKLAGTLDKAQTVVVTPADDIFFS